MENRGTVQGDGGGVWVPAVGALTPPLLPDPQVQQGRREVNHDKAKLHKDRRVTAK